MVGSHVGGDSDSDCLSVDSYVPWIVCTGLSEADCESCGYWLWVCWVVWCGVVTELVVVVFE